MGHLYRTNKKYLAARELRRLVSEANTLGVELPNDSDLREMRIHVTWSQALDHPEEVGLRSFAELHLAVGSCVRSFQREKYETLANLAYAAGQLGLTPFQVMMLAIDHFPNDRAVSRERRAVSHLGVDRLHYSWMSFGHLEHSTVTKLMSLLKDHLPLARATGTET